MLIISSILFIILEYSTYTIMKKLHKILLILLALIISLYLIILYVNQSFIPLKLKAFIEKNLSAQIKGKVEIDDLRFGITKGFILSNIRIYQGPIENNKFIFKAERASFPVIYIPSFGKQRIIIPRISLDRPYMNLDRSKDGTWNISSLIVKKDTKKEPSHFRLIVKSLSFDNGELSYADYYKEKNFQKRIEEIEGTVGLSLPGSLALTCSAKIDEAPFRISARYNPLQKRLSIGLDAEDLNPTEYTNSYLPKEIAKIYKATSDLALKIDISDFRNVNIKGGISIRGLKALLKHTGLEGNYKLSGSASFNIEDLLSAKYNMKLELENAKVTTGFKLLKKASGLKGRLSLSEKYWAIKDLSCSLYNSPVFINGGIRNPHKDFTMEISLKTDLPLNKFFTDTDISVNSGKAVIDANIIYKKDETYKISGNTKIEGLSISHRDNSISGDFSIIGESSGRIGDWKNIGYKGSMTFENTSIESAMGLPLISNVSGDAEFNTKYIDIKRFKGTSAGTEIFLSGNIDYNKKEPDLDLTLKADNLSLSKFLPTLGKDIRTKFKDIEAKGSCSLNINLTGKIGKRDTFIYTGGISLENGALTLGYWPHNIVAIDCDIRFGKQKITWKDLYFNIKGIRYHSYGNLTDFTEPAISLNIKSRDADALAEIKIDKDNIINISKLSGRYRNSTFLVKGKIRDMKNAYADISGTAYLNLKDSPYIFPDKADTLRKIKPEGSLKLSFDMKGPLKEPAQWTLFAEATAEAIYISGLRLDDFYFDYRMRDRFVDIPVAIAYPYGGIINISSRANLKTPEQPYIINIDIKDVDLSGLVKDMDMRDTKIKGRFAAKSVLNGYLKQKGSLQGNGWLQVSDGYLWEFPVLHGMMDVILMVPPEYVILTDAFGNFSISSNRVYTEDFRMLSKAASLLWVGSLGLDGTLDFNITGRFAEDIIKQTTEPGKIASAILREAGNLIMEIRLTGTLTDPKYQIVPFPLKRILKENIVDRFKDIFGNMLE